jgi:hypothetical protein
VVAGAEDALAGSPCVEQLYPAAFGRFFVQAGWQEFCEDPAKARNFVQRAPKRSQQCPVSSTGSSFSDL